MGNAKKTINGFADLIREFRRKMQEGSLEELFKYITDETGYTADLEYLDGNLRIHEGKEFQEMTNSPRYDYQLAINDYWKEFGESSII